LLASQQQLQSQAAATASEASIAVAASLPDAASSPKPKTDAVLAFLVGLVVGTGVLLLRELLRDNVHNLGHLDEIFAAPLVVELTRPRRRPLQALLQLAQGGSRGRDSYPSIRTLRVGLDMLAAEESSRVLVVTSARIDPQSAQLPKTLAEAFARAGQTTTLLDAGPIGEYMPNDLALADEPEPKATSLGRPGRVGLAEAGAKTSLSRTALLTRAAAKREPENAITHLHYGSPNDTRETDLHELIRELIRELAKSSSVVIVDASGLLEFPERALLMNDVDGIIIVSRAYHTKRPDLRRLRHALAFAQPKIAAAVMISR
jgi:Mrp family chromosome partitioning ATPase